MGKLATIGDIVELPQHTGPVKGLIVDDTCETGWCDVMLEDNSIVKWPAVQLIVIEKCEK